MCTAAEGMWSGTERTEAAEASPSEQGSLRATDQELGGEDRFYTQRADNFSFRKLLRSSEAEGVCLLTWTAAY